MTSPLPPSEPVPVNGATNRVRPLLYGQPFTDPNGKECFADRDVVLMELLQDGTAVAQYLLPPDSAIGFARNIVTAAGHIQAKQVDDDGKPTSAAQRLKAFDQAWKGGNA